MVGSLLILAASMIASVWLVTIASATYTRASTSPGRSERRLARSSSTEATRRSTSSTLSWRAAVPQ